MLLSRSGHRCLGRRQGDRVERRLDHRKGHQDPWRLERAIEHGHADDAEDCERQGAQRPVPIGQPAPEWRQQDERHAVQAEREAGEEGGSAPVVHQDRPDGVVQPGRHHEGGGEDDRSEGGPAAEHGGSARGTARRHRHGRRRSDAGQARSERQQQHTGHEERRVVVPELGDNRTEPGTDQEASGAHPDQLAEQFAGAIRISGRDQGLCCRVERAERSTADRSGGHQLPDVIAERKADGTE